MTEQEFVLIQKDKTDDFIHWLNDQDIPWRSGKGDYQLVQVYVNKVWQPLYISNKFPNHYKAIGTLRELIVRYKEQKN